MSKGLGPTQRKILLLLLGGLSLGLSGSPRQYFRIVKLIGKEWEKINQEYLRRAIKKLYASKLVKYKEGGDGTVTLILTEKGRERALTYKIDELSIKKPEKWDKKWRLVIFDIPEKKRDVRDSLRGHLKLLGFYELQKSVFIHPHPCADEIEFLVEFYQVRPYVRQLIVDKIDNELHLKQIFNLL